MSVITDPNTVFGIALLQFVMDRTAYVRRMFAFFSGVFFCLSFALCFYLLVLYFVYLVNFKQTNK